MVEHGRYDLALEIEDRLLRVQCKWARKEGDVLKVTLVTSRHSPVHGYLHRNYSRNEIDAVAAYCAELDDCCFIPIDLVPTEVRSTCG